LCDARSYLPFGTRDLMCAADLNCFSEREVRLRVARSYLLFGTRDLMCGADLNCFSEREVRLRVARSYLLFGTRDLMCAANLNCFSEREVRLREARFTCFSEREVWSRTFFSHVLRSRCSSKWRLKSRGNRFSQPRCGGLRYKTMNPAYFGIY
jgi:hypothetical protein